MRVAWLVAGGSHLRVQLESDGILSTDCCWAAASGMLPVSSSPDSTDTPGADAASFRMSGWTNGTEDAASEPCYFALPRRKLSLADVLKSSWPHIVSRHQASMSAWVTRGSTRSKADRRATPTSSTPKSFRLDALVTAFSPPACSSHPSRRQRSSRHFPLAPGSPGTPPLRAVSRRCRRRRR